jgi:integration host factor subunit beta
MIKSELINSIASKQTKLSREGITAIVDAMLNRMENELGNGGRICVRGFGTLAVRLHAPRVGRNPQTGEIVQVRQKYVVHFKPSLYLSKRVNKTSSQYPIQKL